MVKQIGYDYDRNDGLMSNVRVGVVECKDIDRIPDTMFLRLEDMTGRALIFVRGRAPRCYRCVGRLHKVAQCTAPRSYANASRRGEGDQQEMDDSETEDLHTDLGQGATADADADIIAPAISVDESSDDIEVDTTDPQVDADGFRQPTDHKRRQQRAKKRLAKKSPTSSDPVPRKMSATEPEETDAPAKEVSTDNTVAAAASTDDDATVRRHSRTRVPSGRSRQTKSTGEERKMSV